MAMASKQSHESFGADPSLAGHHGSVMPTSEAADASAAGGPLIATAATGAQMLSDGSVSASQVGGVAAAAAPGGHRLSLTLGSRSSQGSSYNAGQTMAEKQHELEEKLMTLQFLAKNRRASLPAVAVFHPGPSQ